MCDRDEFEKTFPVPDGIEWIDERQGYRITSDGDYWFDSEGQAHFRGFIGQWLGWQAARAQQAGSGEAVGFTTERHLKQLHPYFACKRESEGEWDVALYTHPSGSVPDRLIEAVKALHIDDDMFGIDFQDEMATYQCQYCSFDMEHYGPSLDAYKLIKHDDDCPITKLRSLLATTPQPADNWIKCSEQPPNEVFSEMETLVDLLRDAAMAEGKVDTCYDEPNKNPRLAVALNWLADWMPTGLKRPNPPEQESE